MKLKSVKFKISIFYTAILGVILMIYSGVLYVSLYGTLYHELDNELLQKADNIMRASEEYVKLFDVEPPQKLWALCQLLSLNGECPVFKDVDLSTEHKKKIVYFRNKWALYYDKADMSEDFIQIMSNQREVLAATKNMSRALRMDFLSRMMAKSSMNTGFIKLKMKKKNLRCLQFKLNFHDGQQYFLQIGTSQKPIIDLLENRQTFIAISIPLVLFFSSFIGMFLTERILKPVNEITKMAKTITHKDLTGRIQMKDVDDEMRSLVEAFNEMIARLETSFDHINEFSSQVAHELKTPIAILRGEIELALRKERDPKEYQRVLHVSLGETQRLLRIVEDLLLLAKLDYRPDIFKMEYFEVTQFFKDLYEQTKILAVDKNLKVHLSLPDQEIVLKGDKFHLRRLFYNIIHNAVKFTTAEGSITIKIKAHEDYLMTTITDTGMGMSQEEQFKVFDRFYHADKGKGIEAGNGLGMNIALSIAKIHLGSIEFSSELNQGTTFLVKLPLI